MLSVAFRGASGAATLVYMVAVDLSSCDMNPCGTLILGTNLTLVSYICILLPAAWNTGKRIYGI